VRWSRWFLRLVDNGEPPPRRVMAEATRAGAAARGVQAPARATRGGRGLPRQAVRGLHAPARRQARGGVGTGAAASEGPAAAGHARCGSKQADESRTGHARGTLNAGALLVSCCMRR
jgi:hypothetical protein